MFAQLNPSLTQVPRGLRAEAALWTGDIGTSPTLVLENVAIAPGVFQERIWRRYHRRFVAVGLSDGQVDLVQRTITRPIQGLVQLMLQNHPWLRRLVGDEQPQLVIVRKLRYLVCEIHESDVPMDLSESEKRMYERALDADEVDRNAWDEPFDTSCVELTFDRVLFGHRRVTAHCVIRTK